VRVTKDIGALLLGLMCAGAGGELFVRSAVGLAAWARVPARLVATTVVAFATSSPELAVSIGAARAGEPELALGDALGSNVVNFGVVLALGLLLSGTSVSRATAGRDYSVALLVPGVTALLAIDGVLSRLDAVALLAGFVGWLAFSAREAHQSRDSGVEAAGVRSRVRTLAVAAVGLVLLVAAARLVVSGATGVAAAAGLDLFVTGAVLVAIGTSVPEIATVVSAKLRQHHEVALGTVIGSNIFNGAFIVAVAALIRPIELVRSEVAVALAFGALLVIVAHPGRNAHLPRRRGVVLFAVYVAYLGVLRATQGGH
jgi:cation:H+ antiporter